MECVTCSDTILVTRKRTRARVFPARWRDCGPFVEALKRRGYIGEDGHECMSPGMYLYMYELWLDGVCFCESGVADGH